MVKRQDEQRRELRENVCGGTGKAEVRHIFEPEEMSQVRLFNHITIEPGAEFGIHTHHDKAEIYYVLKGEVLTGEKDGEYTLRPGDSSYTGDGAYHYLRNAGTEPAELIAVIAGVGSVTMGKTSCTETEINP